MSRYAVISCDGCRDQVDDGSGGDDMDLAEIRALNDYEWKRDGGKHFCPDCWASKVKP